LPNGSALVRIEIAGICGTDVKMYAKPQIAGPVIMGHENIGVIAETTEEFRRRKHVEVGDRIFVEHYVACFDCKWCHRGDYRHCELTDWRTNSNARRYGYTSANNPYHLWGGFAEYMYLPWNSVIHKVPHNVSAELAGIVTPLSNGVQWALLDAKVGFGHTVLIQGPGQQGLSQVAVCKLAGASKIIVTGRSSDAARLKVATALGADHIIDIQVENPRECIADLTSGKGVDTVLDCTAGAGTAPILLGIDVLKRREGVLLVQGELAAFPDFPLKKLTEKAITIKSARGHCFQACEHALSLLASHRLPMELLTTHRFGLDEVDRAIRAVGGCEPSVIHVSLMPQLRKGPE
jgi:threonine dehydrogenase-like Zn-dependent dehydrogenase